MPVKYIKRNQKMIGQVWTPDEKVGIGVIAGIVFGAVLGTYIAWWNLNKR